MHTYSKLRLLALFFMYNKIPDKKISLGYIKINIQALISLVFAQRAISLRLIYIHSSEAAYH